MVDENLAPSPEIKKSDETCKLSVQHRLEIENENLKVQLADAHERLSIQFDELQEPSNEKNLKDVRKNFELEKSARSDLEMFVAVLNTQKAVLQEDCERLKAELCNVCRLYEEEKAKHNELKQTWKMANEEFLSQQMNLLSELEEIRGVHTSSERRYNLSYVSREYIEKKNESITNQHQITPHRFSVNTSVMDKRLATTSETSNPQIALTSSLSEKEPESCTTTRTNDMIWNRTPSNLESTCEMCHNYESQLQILQSEIIKLNEREQNREDEMNVVTEELRTERKHIGRLESSMTAMCSDFRVQVDIYEKNQLIVEEQIEALRNQFKLFQESVLNQLI